MRQILIFLIIFTSFIFKADAETWSCPYTFKDKKGIVEVKRKGYIFTDRTGMYTIHQETNDYIVLIETYPHDNIPDSPSVFLLYLDKRKKGMSMVGLGYPTSTAIIRGICSIF